MLAALPLVLACYGAQPCQPAIAAPTQLVRSASPAAITTHTPPREALTGDTGQSLQTALQRVSITSATTASPSRRAQAARPQSGRTTYNKAMFVFLGVLAGCYAGAYFGEAMEENAGLVGMPIGAAVGGTMAWILVR